MTLVYNLYLFCAAVAIINLVSAAVLLFVLREARNREANLVLGLLLLCLAGSLLSDILNHFYFLNQYPQLLALAVTSPGTGTLLPLPGNRRLGLPCVLDAVRCVCRTSCQSRALLA
jgi:hypothetical protein